MKYRASLVIVLMLLHLSCSPARLDQSRQQTSAQGTHGPTLSLGMSHELALEIIRECGGQDITSNLAVAGPRGKWPLSDLFWRLEEYNLVLEIFADNGKVVGIDYWTLADFLESKDHRSESKKSLKSLMFEKQTKTVKTQALIQREYLK